MERYCMLETGSLQVQTCPFNDTCFGLSPDCLGNGYGQDAGSCPSYTVQYVFVELFLSHLLDFFRTSEVFYKRAIARVQPEVTVQVCLFININICYISTL